MIKNGINYPTNQVFCVFANIKVDCPVFYYIHAFFLIIFTREWCLPMENLEQQNPQTPYIEAEVMRLVQDHLWGHVVKGPTERLSGPRRGILGTPTKVTEFYISIAIEQEVLGLEIIKIVGIKVKTFRSRWMMFFLCK